MTRQVASWILCAFPLLGSACATKSFVENELAAAEARSTRQVTATETKLTERIDVQDSNLRETAAGVAASRQAIDATSQHIKALDTRVDEVGVLATDARTRGEASRNAMAGLSHRFARRNSYRLLETRFVYFGPDQADIRSQDLSELDDVANALKADVNAVLELQGFTDPRGSDRYNYQLARERSEAVTRYLVQRHGIELRQVRAVIMGRVELGAGDKGNTEVLAKARRVDLRLLAPWSSWEDAAQAETIEPAPAQAAALLPTPPLECANPMPATTVVPPVRLAPTEVIRVSWVDRSFAGSAPLISTKVDRVATPKISLRPADDGDGAKSAAPARALVEFLKSLSPEDLGGR